MTSEVFADWGKLPATAIRALVYGLKKRNRWRQDGPSLRALNKHWCEELDLCITRVCPLEGSKFTPQDLRALSKFKNLHVLNLSPFLKSLAFSFCKDFISYLDGLTKLRSLKQLHVCGTLSYALGVLGDDCFQNLRSVRYEEVRFHQHKPFPLLSSSSIQDACFVLPKGQKWLQFPLITSLKFLTIWCRKLPFQFAETITTLKSLESLTIASAIKDRDIIIQNYELLATMTSLTSLELQDSPIATTKWLTELAGLKRLSVRVENFQTGLAEDWRYFSKLQNLTSFSIPHKPLPLDLVSVLEANKKIQCLELFRLPEMNVGNNTLFSQLSCLTIAATNDSVSIQEILSLQSLEVCSIYDTGWFDGILDPSVPSWSQKLTVLELNIGLDQVAMYQISFIRSLRKFCWYTTWWMWNFHLGELWKLPHLTELYLHHRCHIDELSRTPALQKVIEKLDLFGFVSPVKEIPLTRWTKRNLPHIRVTYRRHEFEAFSQFSQKTPGMINPGM